MDTIDALSTLDHLIEACRASQKAFRNATIAADSLDLKIACSQIAAKRGEYAVALDAMGPCLGRNLETSPTIHDFFGDAWLDLTPAFAHADDAAVLEECEQANERLLRIYADALDRDDFPVQLREVVERQGLMIDDAGDRLQETAINEFAFA